MAERLKRGLFMTSQLMFAIDFNRCINCKTCEMACNAHHGLTDVHRRSVFTFEETQKEKPIHLSISCNHCANPVCVSVCPENNFQKRGDGIVLHQAYHCQACMRCITACPFHAPKLNPKTNRADKCNFCVERLDQGLKPVCVENCITGALSMMEINSSELRSFTDSGADIPIMGYTNPSIFLTKKRSGLIFLREE
jgi:Fe-S-cluster-containing dehydrogenase component